MITDAAAAAPPSVTHVHWVPAAPENQPCGCATLYTACLHTVYRLCQVLCVLMIAPLTAYLYLSLSPLSTPLLSPLSLHLRHIRIPVLVRLRFLVFGCSQE